MKKLGVFLVIGMLIVAIPTAAAFVRTRQTKTTQYTVETPGGSQVSFEDPPDWANGGFGGAWGTSRDNILGYFKGLYGQRGRTPFFVGVWNTTDNSKQGVVRGICLRGFLLAKINLTGDARTAPLVGFYTTNDEHHFAARVMSVRGPPVVAMGRFQPRE